MNKLSFNYFLFKSRNLYYKIKGIPSFKKYPYITKKGKHVIHISAFSHSNTGDLYLPVILRNLFNNFIPVAKWTNRHVFKIVTEKNINSFNKSDLINELIF